MRSREIFFFKMEKLMTCLYAEEKYSVKREISIERKEN